MKHIIITIFVALAQPALSQESAYVSILTKSGIKIDIPRNWKLFNQKQLDTIKASTEGVVEMANLSEKFGDASLHATYHDGEIFGDVRLTQLPVKVFTKKNVEELVNDPEFLLEIGKDVSDGLQKGFTIQGVKLISFKITKGEVSNLPAMHALFVRTSDPKLRKSNVVVHQYHFPYPDGHKCILTLSYSEVAGQLMIPIKEKILTSVKTTK